MNLKSVIDNEKRKLLISEIQYYFLEEQDLKLGDLASTLLLDFFCEKIGPEFYNQGVFDSYKYLQNSLDDLLAIQKQSNASQQKLASS